MASTRDGIARGLMAGFAERTGLTAARPERRYLWTDAFAVCNLLGLAQSSGDDECLALARRLVARVHHVLGRHRADDRRTGWISGLPEHEGERHPTAGGLRIGKALPERGPDEPFDEDLEWERDGQYFHYLTKWMHALDQMARVAGAAPYAAWAGELAVAAHRAFTWSPSPGARRMYWKCSIDLSRPLVTSMGHHDALDGLVTCLQLGAGADAGPPALRAATADYAAMIDLRALATSDALGLGGLLCDAWRVQQIAPRDATGEAVLVEALLDAAAAGLRELVVQPDLRMPAERRLAFRELGLATGLAAIAHLRERAAGLSAPGRASLERIEPYAVLRENIESFWLAPEHRATALWREHADINEVMLATSLAPSGFLVLVGPVGS